MIEGELSSVVIPLVKGAVYRGTHGRTYYGVPTAQYLCGKDDYPGGAPGQVVGGKPS